MDAHMSLANGRSSALRLADISTPIPAESVVNWWHPNGQHVAAQQWNLNVFALHCSLAVIEAGAAEELFSAKARARSRIINATVYESITSRLTAWRERNVLSSLATDDVLTAMYRSDLIHSIVLEGAYFRTADQLYAASILVGFSAKSDVFAPEALQAMVALGTAPCYGDAQRFLRLVVLMPQGNLSTTW